MKVLFVSRTESAKFVIPSLIKAQGKSLKNIYIDVCYFKIKGKGFKGYLSHIPKLKKYLKDNPVDIIHAHYSFAGVFASLTFTKIPIVVSLLGTDVFSRCIIKKTIIFLRKLFSWNALIVKSLAMNNILKGGKGIIIPNGVNISLFKPINSTDCKNRLCWDPSIKHILFAANPERTEKNFALAEKSLRLLLDNNVSLHSLGNIAHKDMPVWLNAADVIILSSLWEGSPNVIKEAMACNRPIVATKVGDIPWLFGKEPGHYLADFIPKDFSLKIKQSLNFHEKYGKTKGRERLIDIGLDSLLIAKRIINVYKAVQKYDKLYSEERFSL